MSKPDAPRHDSFRPVLGAAVGLFIALLAIASLKSYRDLEAARDRERLLETRIEQSQGQIERLRGRIDRLKGDPGTLERLAREELGMVRPGDVVIELPQEGRKDSKDIGDTKAAAVASPPSLAAPIPTADSAGPPASPPAQPHPAPPASGPPAPRSP